MKRLIRIYNKDVRITGRLLRIARLEGDGYDFLENPQQMIESLREGGAPADLFTFTQKLPETEPKYPYPMEWDNFAATPVSSFENWWNHQIRPEARNRVRQAGKKGIVTREVPFDDALVKEISDIYNESPVRQGRRFPHYGKDLKTVHEEAATFPESSFFIGAFLEEKLIGFAKLTTNETGTQANLMNILSAIEHRDKAPTNALIAQAVRSCAERSISYLVYQSFAYGNKQPDGLTKFKEVNGFRRFDVPRYYVPLTFAGKAGFRLGLHRRLVDQIPESMRGRLREWRTSWYNRKLQTARESA